MTYKLSQMGHDPQNWSVTVVHAVNVSTTQRRVWLSCVSINGPLGAVPVGICHNVWCGKTGMACLPDGEKVLWHV